MDDQDHDNIIYNVYHDDHENLPMVKNPSFDQVVNEQAEIVETWKQDHDEDAYNNGKASFVTRCRSYNEVQGDFIIDND